MESSFAVSVYNDAAVREKRVSNSSFLVVVRADFCVFVLQQLHGSCGGRGGGERPAGIEKGGGGPGPHVEC